MTAAEQLRDAGMAATENAADPRLILAVDKVIADLNATGQSWSANDARDRLPVTSHGLVGSRVKAASMRRPVEMVAVGWVASTLPSTHGKPVVIWKGVR